MSPLRILILLAGLTSAMPIHVGGSWVWRVVELSTNKITFRSAVVLDSTPTDSGTSWTIVARDSVSRANDTVVLRSTSDGLQKWTRWSRLLPIEPSSWDNLERSWGEAAFNLDTKERVDYSIYQDPVNGPSMTGSFQRDADGIVFHDTTSAPLGLWSDSLGLERFRILSSSPQDWSLVRFGSRDLTPKPAALSVPDSGTTFEWQELEQTIDRYYGTMTTIPSKRIRWTILSRARDSADWTIVKVKTVTIPWNGAETTDSVVLSLNASTLQRMPARKYSTYLLLDDAWREDWIDSVEVDRGVRHRKSFNTQGSESNIVIWASSVQSKRILDGTIDSSSSIYGMATPGTIPGATSVNTIVVLLSKGGDIVRPALDDTVKASIPMLPKTTSVQYRFSGAVRPTLADIERLHPFALVRWTDLQGRTGSTTLKRFEQSRPTSGMLFLSADLPDGTRWEGKSLNLR